MRALEESAGVRGPAVVAARALEVRRGRGRAAFRLRVPGLALERGRVLAVLGANGAGKTTLLRALAGLLPAQEGRVEGRPERVALVFQHPVLLRGSALWNVEVALWRAGLGRRGRREAAHAALARFGIESLAARDAATLSGGEVRRIALARAFAQAPEALLLDEPFDDLDAESREALCVDLARAIRDEGVAVALVTHDLRQALLLADAIAVLCRGELVQVGPRAEVLQRPATPEVAALVGMSNGFRGRIAARESDAIAHVELDAPAPSGEKPSSVRAATPLPVGSPVWVGARPEHVKLEPAAVESDEGGTGRVRERISDGALVHVWIDWQGLSLRAHLLDGRGLGHELAPGDRVAVAVRPEHWHVLPLEP